MSLLPSSADVTPDGEPRVVGLDSEEADDLMAALSSGTARRLLAELHEEPAPPGRLAERVGTSLQNVQYHLSNLESAGAVEVVGTAYSEKGREMQVYGPADSPLVIFAGEEGRASGLRAALARVFGAFAALAGGSLAVQELFGESVLRRAGDDAAPPGGGSDGAGDATATPTPADDSADGGTAETPTGMDEQSRTGDQGGTATGTSEAEGTATPMEESDAEEDAGGGGAAAGDDGAAGGDGGGAESMSPTETEAPTPTPTEFEGTPVADGGAWDLSAAFDGLFASGMPPGLAFFIGGATVLTIVVATTYVRAQP